MDPVHLIPVLVLKRRYRITEEAELKDPRIIVAGCRDHHAPFDNGFLPVPVEAVGGPARAYAASLEPPYSFEDDFRYAAG